MCYFWKGEEKRKEETGCEGVGRDEPRVWRVPVLVRCICGLKWHLRGRDQTSRFHSSIGWENKTWLSVRENEAGGFCWSKWAQTTQINSVFCSIWKHFRGESAVTRLRAGGLSALSSAAQHWRFWNAPSNPPLHLHFTASQNLKQTAWHSYVLLIAFSFPSKDGPARLGKQHWLCTYRNRAQFQAWLKKRMGLGLVWVFKMFGIWY